jgi:hypothetical protein
MATETARLDLVKPDYTDTADIAVINANMDTLDGAVGVSIVNTVGDIAEPFNGQFAYELDFKELRFFISGEWLLVAAGDQNSGNPDRIRLPAGTLDDLEDTTNAFQIGADSTSNLSVDEGKLQSRNNEAADTLQLNPLGGNVEIGNESVFIMSEDGMEITRMDSIEDLGNTNITVNQQTYYIGGDPADVNPIIAPPSGKIKVTASCSMTTAGTGHRGYFSFDVQRVSNGNIIQSPGGDGKEAILQGNVRATLTLVDIVKDLIPGEEYRIRTEQKRETGSDDVTIQWRKVVAEPVF